MATHEEIPLSKNAKKLVDLIVKIIVNTTFSFLIWKIIKKLSKNIKKQERAKRDLNKNI